MWKWLVTEPWFTPNWNPEFEYPNDISDAMLARVGSFHFFNGHVEKQLSGISCRCRCHEGESKWVEIQIY